MKKDSKLSGVLLIDKPVGPTSHDIVAHIRRILTANYKLPTAKTKVGHTGTLDPFASGLLIIAIGSATRLIQFTHHWPKTYETTIALGATSTTDDATGDITRKKTTEQISNSRIESVLATFIGSYEQLPPAYSAKKIAGQPAYKRARRGESVTLKKKKITIHNIELQKIEYPHVTLTITCSTGTYIRSLARDIGEKLNIGAYCETLRRTKIGPFDIENSVSPNQISPQSFPQLPLSELQKTNKEETKAEVDKIAILSHKNLVSDLPCLKITESDIGKIRHGQSIPVNKIETSVPTMYAIQDTEKNLIGIGEIASSLLFPKIIL